MSYELSVGMSANDVVCLKLRINNGVTIMFCEIGIWYNRQLVHRDIVFEEKICITQ